MAIRSRRVISASVSSASSSGLPTFLSAAWPGLASWLRAMICATGVFALLAGFAWHGSNDRLADITTLFVTIPAGMFFMMLLAAMLWTLLARIPFETGLLFAGRVMPLAWVIPLAEIVRTAGKGMASLSVPLGANGYIAAALTGSILPFENALPLALRAGIVITALITAFVVWFTGKHFIKSIIAFVVMSIASIKLLAFPTLIGQWTAFAAGRGWIADPADMLRETIRGVTNGYWWNNLYDRFPSAVDSQADIAIRLATAGYVALALGLILAVLFIWRLPVWKRVARHAFVSWSTLHLAIDIIGAAVVTAFAMKVPAMVGAWWLAFAIAILGLLALRLHLTLERCVHQFNDGVGDGTDPVACGDVLPTQASALSIISLLYALMVSLALGWPIFVSVIAALAASWLSRDRLWAAWPWINTVFRAAGAAMLALAGFFFASQNARLTGVAAVVMLLAAGHRLAVELLWPSKNS
jgi:hypothetical protein